MTWWQALAYLAGGAFVVGVAHAVDQVLSDRRHDLAWVALALAAVFWPVILAMLLLGLGALGVSRLVRRWL